MHINILMDDVRYKKPLRIFHSELLEIYFKNPGFKPFCFFCGKRLSSKPIYKLENGNKICGACSTTTKQPVSRCTDYEKFLKHWLFPCKYEKNGCDVLVRFNQAGDHEDGCFYRYIFCLSSQSHPCSWKGKIPELLEHFTGKHSDLLTDKIDFKFWLGKSQEGVFMANLGGFHFIYRYKYNGGKGCLYYDIRYFCWEVREVSCNMRVMNDSNPKYNIAFKGFVCSVYDIHFYHMTRLETVNLHYYRDLLGKPDCVTVTLDLAIQNPKQPKKQSTIRHLKCDRCQGHLTLPTFVCLEGIICANCRCEFTDYETWRHKARWLGFRPLKHVTFQCRWPDCKYSGKKINKHEVICKHRICECVESECKLVFKGQDAVAHLEGHGYVYFTNEYVFNMKLTEHGREIKLCTIMKNRLVSFHFEIYCEKLWYRGDMMAPLVHRNFKTCTMKVKFKLMFKHKHCKVRSEMFEVFHHKRLSIKELPRCFLTYEELTVNLDNFKIASN